MSKYRRSGNGGGLEAIVIFASCTLLLLAVAQCQDIWPMGMRLMFAGAGLLFAALAIAAVIYWMQYQSANIAAVTERAKIVENMAGLNPEQLTAFMDALSIWNVEGQPEITDADTNDD